MISLQCRKQIAASYSDDHNHMAWKVWRRHCVAVHCVCLSFFFALVALKYTISSVHFPVQIFNVSITNFTVYQRNGTKTRTQFISCQKIWMEAANKSCLNYYNSVSKKDMQIKNNKTPSLSRMNRIGIERWTNIQMHKVILEIIGVKCIRAVVVVVLYLFATPDPHICQWYKVSTAAKATRIIEQIKTNKTKWMYTLQCNIRVRALDTQTCEVSEYCVRTVLNCDAVINWSRETHYFHFMIIIVSTGIG